MPGWDEPRVARRPPRPPGPAPPRPPGPAPASSHGGWDARPSSGDAGHMPSSSSSSLPSGIGGVGGGGWEDRDRSRGAAGLGSGHAMPQRPAGPPPPVSGGAVSSRGAWDRQAPPSNSSWDRPPSGEPCPRSRNLTITLVLPLPHVVALRALIAVLLAASATGFDVKPPSQGGYGDRWGGAGRTGPPSMTSADHHMGGSSGGMGGGRWDRRGGDAPSSPRAHPPRPPGPAPASAPIWSKPKSAPMWKKPPSAPISGWSSVRFHAFSPRTAPHLSGYKISLARRLQQHRKRDYSDTHHSPGGGGGAGGGIGVGGSSSSPRADSMALKATAVHSKRPRSSGWGDTAEESVSGATTEPAVLRSPCCCGHATPCTQRYVIGWPGAAVGCPATLERLHNLWAAQLVPATL